MTLLHNYSQNNAKYSEGRLLENIIYFGRVLRNIGIPIGPAHIIDAVKAVKLCGLESRDSFYWALHCVFVQKHEQSILFDEAFHILWRNREFQAEMLDMMLPQASANHKEKRAGQSRLQDVLATPQTKLVQRHDEIEIDARETASIEEVFRSKDFAQMNTDEIRRASNALRQLKLPNDRVKTRRFNVSHNKKRPDLRRMMQVSMRSGSTVIPMRWRDRDVEQPPIVALCDISGSMNQYSRVFLHFLHGLMVSRKHMHCFVFGTNLSNITRHLKCKDVDEALITVGQNVTDWSGGTLIGEALVNFNRHWSRRVLSRSPTVLLISDGLERENIDSLSPAMDRLHRSCRQLIWLNPLLRFDGFEAKAAGIKAMLPHVDHFLPIHSLNAVADLCQILNNQR